MNNNYNYNYNDGMTNQTMNYNSQTMNYNNQTMSTYTTSSVTQTTSGFTKDPNKLTLLGYLGAVILIIGSFLDFATLSITYEGEEYFSQTVNYFIVDGEPKDGLFVCLLAISLIGTLFKKKHLKALITAAVAGGLVLIDFISTPSDIEAAKQQYSYMFSNGLDVKCIYGPAFYVCLIGIIVLAIYFVLYFKNFGNIVDSFHK